MGGCEIVGKGVVRRTLLEGLDPRSLLLGEESRAEHPQLHLRIVRRPLGDETQEVRVSTVAEPGQEASRRVNEGAEILIDDLMGGASGRIIVRLKERGDQRLGLG